MVMTIVHHMDDDELETGDAHGHHMDMKWNAQNKDITCRTFYFIGHWCIEKCTTDFRIDNLTIKRSKLVLHVGYLVLLVRSSMCCLERQVVV